MRFLVINGSPKGEYSVTLQTVLYLEKRYPQHTFEIIHAGQKIRTLEKDFEPVRESIRRADLLIFAYPVYTFIAPSQLHRFMELLSLTDCHGKFATQITTSKHFYDMTAHRYIEDNCRERGMKFIRGLSADMDDLLTEKGQKDACAFLEYALYCMENDLHEPRWKDQPFPAEAIADVPETADNDGKPGDGKPGDGKPGDGKPGDVVIVTDCTERDKALAAMIARFRAVLPRKTRVINIREYPFKGGCLGCFNCAVSGKCVYKDGFDDFLRNDIQSAQAIVYAFRIQDHSMGARFKLYDDRQFCNGHRTVTMGMPVGYLVSGNYSEEANLQTILEARAQVGGNFLAGVATDEETPNEAVDKLAKSLVYALDNRYAPPQNFFGVGGMKVFRDLIWIMQGMMKADHRFYKAHGQYDFPQKQWKTMLKMQLVGLLLASPKVKAKMGNAMNEGMLAPYKKVLEKADKQR